MNAKISGRIAFFVSQGKSLPEAFDMVLGAGAYMKLAGELYDRLNAKKN